MVDYYWEYGAGFYQRTQGLEPASVEAEVLKITKGKRSGTEEDYRQAASRVPGYNAAQAEQDRAAIRAGFEAHEREQEALKGSFMGREAQARVYGGPAQKPIVGIEAAKAAELQAARAEAARRQSEQATSPTEALAIQRMLRSPTAQFASQEAAQRGYELASRYDRSFAPEQVRATLAPEYQPQAPQDAPSRFFYPAPREQAGIRPAFPTPARPGSIAEREAFESRTRGFYTYGTVRRLEAVSSRLQTGFERVVGYDERSSRPKKAVVGFGSAFTGLPAFAGQVAGAGEAIIRYPSASLRGLPTGFKILSSQVAEQARTKPVEFVGSLAGMAAIGRYAPKLRVPKLTAEGFKEFTRSETASLGRRADPWAKIPTMRETAAKAGKELTRKIEFGRAFKEPSGAGVAIQSGKQQLIAIQEQKFVNPLRGGVETTYSPQIAIREARYVRAEQRSVAAQSMGNQAQMYRVRTLKTRAEAAQQPVLTTVQSVGLKTPIIPYAVQISKQVSKQVRVVPQIQKQAPQQINKQKPVVVQRQRQSQIQRQVQRQAARQVPMTIQTQALLQVQKQIQKQAQVQRPAQTRMQRPAERFQPPRTKLIEKPKQERTKEPSEFKKQSAIFRGARKYTTKLGGKTLKQLSAELKGKKTIRRKRKK
jgi:hypothetical protein